VVTVPTPRALLHGWLVLLLAERAAELLLSERNARRARAAGAVEAGRGHYPVMVAFHAALLAAWALEPVLLPRPWPGPAALAALAVAAVAQGLRWWAVATLGERWSTRILVRPGAPPVTGGPYRFLRHPNYVAVALEVAAVPLAGGAVLSAAAGSALNALLLLAVRIPAEEEALGPAWRRAFARGRDGRDA
jgi:methyltransferase